MTAPNYGELDILYSALVPIIVYENAETHKYKILEENKEKTAIYMWKHPLYNILTGTQGTDSYTFAEIQLLIKILKENFDLNCTYNKRGKDGYRIYIMTDSMDKFRSLVTPYFHESMMYKLIA